MMMMMRPLVLTARLLLYKRSEGTIGSVDKRVTVTTTLRDEDVSPIYAGCGKCTPWDTQEEISISAHG